MYYIELKFLLYLNNLKEHDTPQRIPWRSRNWFLFITIASCPLFMAFLIQINPIPPIEYYHYGVLDFAT